MSTCPSCGCDLSKSGLDDGMCPACGCMLVWPDDSGSTAASAGDAGVSPAAPQPAAAPTPQPTQPPPNGGNRLTIKQIVHTIVQRGDSDQNGGPAEPSPTPEAQLPADDAVQPEICRTINPRELSDSEMTRMMTLWQPSVTMQGKGAGTERSSSQLTVYAHNLVVRSRSVQTGQTVDLKSAEYELLKVIGEGGVGVVYAARQASLNRTVAVKMLKPHIADDEDHRAKFLSEAVVTGDLDHPNIVPIHELGSDESGALFYSMKCVGGTPWSKVIRQKTLGENLQILLSVADAIAFAHSRGVIHRDLKPENVMLGDFGEVLVMDWGIALSTSLFMKAESIAQSSSMGGTPAYMAPEMATGPVEAIGAASDVYLFGAILFEIIAGYPPHTGRDVMACLRAAARNEIRPTDKSGELLEIAYRAMAADPAKRYDSVQDFQTAIRQYQAHSESIVLAERARESLNQAATTSDYQDYSRAMFAFQEALEIWDGNAAARRGRDETRYRYADCAYRKGDYDLGVSLLDPGEPGQARLLGRIQAAQQERDARQRRLRRARQTMVALAAVIFLVVTGGLFAVYREKQVAEGERDKAENRRIEAVQAREREAEAAELARQKSTEAERQRNEAKRQRDEAQAQKAAAVAQRRRAERASYVAQIGVAAERIASNAFLDAERLLAYYEEPGRSQHRHWEWGYLERLCHLDAGRPQNADQRLLTPARIECVACAPDGRWLIAGTVDGFIHIWETVSGRKLAPLSHGSAVRAIAVTHDGQYLASAGELSTGPQGAIKIWKRTDTGAGFVSESEFEAHTVTIHSLRFSPDDRLLLSSSDDATARLWQWQTGTEQRALRGHFGAVHSAAFAPDGSRIVTASEDGTVRVWSSETGAEETRFDLHQGAVYAAEFDPSGRYVASAGRDEWILLWDPEQVDQFDFEELKDQFAQALTSDDWDRGALRSGQPPVPNGLRILAGHTAEIRSLAFASAPDPSDGTVLVSGGHDNTVRVWDLASDPSQVGFMRVFRGHGGWVRSAIALPRAGRFVSGGYDKQLKIWDEKQYKEVRTLRDRQTPIADAAFSRDGQRAITAGRDGVGVLWNLADGTVIDVLQDAPPEVARTDTGDAATRFVSTLVEGHEFLVTNASFLTGGNSRLVTNAGDGTTRLWNLETGGQMRRWQGTGQAGALAVSDDGDWMLTGGTENEARLWDLRNPESDFTPLEGHADEVTAVAFSHAGDLRELRLVTGDAGGRCKLWKWDAESSTWTVYAEPAGHLPGRQITAAGFLPDNRRLLTASQDHTVMQWDPQSGRRMGPLMLSHPGAVRGFDIASDGRHVVTVCRNRSSYQLSWWDADRAELLQTTEAPGSMVTSVALQPDDTAALVAATDERGASAVWRWRLADNQYAPLWPEDRQRDAVWCAVPSPDGRRVLTAGGSRARLCSVQDGQQLQSYSPHAALTAAAFSPSGTLAVSADEFGDVKIWSVDPQAADYLKVHRKIPEAHRQAGSACAVHAAVFSPLISEGDSYLLTCGDDRTAKLWQIADNEIRLLNTFSGHTQPVRDAVFSPDGRYIATASLDGTARTWKIPEPGATPVGHVVGEERTHAMGVLCVAFSPDGRRLATGSENNTIKVWNLDDDKVWNRDGDDAETLPLSGHTASITSVAFSPDGRRVISGSRDAMAKVWDADSGDPVLNLNRHQDEVTCVAFSTDGSRVLTGSGDQTAIVWLADAISPTIVLSEETQTLPAAGEFVIVDDQAILLDPDATHFDGAQLTIRVAATADASQDGSPPDILLEIHPTPQIQVVDGELQYRADNETEAAVTIGSVNVDPPTPGHLQIQLTERANRAAVQSLLRSVAAKPRSDIDASLAVQFQLTTGDGLSSHLAERKLEPDATASDDDQLVAGQ